MPSFRVTLTIGALRHGASPDQVLPAAVDSAARLTIVEASDVAVVAGAARITVRFTGDRSDTAAELADVVAEGVGEYAEVVNYVVTRMVKGRWIPV